MPDPAQRPHPTVADAKALANKYDWDGVIVISLDYATGQYHYASYGTDRTRCQRTQRVADAMVEGRPWWDE